MSVRVNLLKPHEIQQQSAVSRDILRRGGTAVGVGVALLGIAFVSMQYIQTQSLHKRLQTKWAAIEPQYLELKAISDQQAGNAKYVTELDAWSRSRVDWDAPLVALQNLIPDNLQFTTLFIGSEVVISEKEPKTKKSPGTPARLYNFYIEGRAEGAMSDQDVIAFVETVRESPEFSPWLKWVRLQGMQRATPNPQVPSEEARIFRVNGAATERMMK